METSRLRLSYPDVRLIVKYEQLPRLPIRFVAPAYAIWRPLQLRRKLQRVPLAYT